MDVRGSSDAGSRWHNSCNLLVHSGCARAAEGGLIKCCCFFSSFFNDFCQANYLNIYWTDLHQICRVARTTAVDERSEVSFSILMDVAMATNFVDQIQAQSTQLSRHTTRSATAAQANKFPDSMDAGKPIN